MPPHEKASRTTRRCADMDCALSPYFTSGKTSVGYSGILTQGRTILGYLPRPLSLSPRPPTGMDSHGLTLSTPQGFLPLKPTPLEKVELRTLAHILGSRRTQRAGSTPPKTPASFNTVIVDDYLGGMMDFPPSLRQMQVDWGAKTSKSYWTFSDGADSRRIFSSIAGLMRHLFPGALFPQTTTKIWNDAFAHFAQSLTARVAFSFRRIRARLRQSTFLTSRCTLLSEETTPRFLYCMSRTTRESSRATTTSSTRATSSTSGAMSATPLERSLIQSCHSIATFVLCSTASETTIPTTRAPA